MSDIVTTLEALVARLKELQAKPNAATAAATVAWINEHWDALKPMLLTYLGTHKSKDTDLVTINVESPDTELRNITTQIYYGNTIAQLKEVVESKMGIPRTNQDIRQRGISVGDEVKVGTMMTDTPGMYTVRVYIKATVRVAIPLTGPSGVKDSVSTTPTTTGSYVKNVILERYGISADRYRLVVGTHVLLDTDNVQAEWVKAGRQPIRVLL